MQYDSREPVFRLLPLMLTENVMVCSPAWQVYVPASASAAERIISLFMVPSD